MNIKKYISIVLAFWLFSFGHAVFAGELAENLYVTDKGRQETPNSIVRHVSMAGKGTPEDPFLLWYEDQAIGEGRVKFAQSLSDETQFNQGVAITMEGRLNEKQNIRRPAVFQHAGGFGMYFIETDSAYQEVLNYSESTDGQSWSMPVAVSGITGLTGVVDVVAENGEVRVYWTDSQNTLRVSVSPDGNYMSFPEPATLVLNKHSYRPTGQVIRYNDAYYLFFVCDAETGSQAYAGLARSVDGLTGWEVVRSDTNPLLTDTTSTRNKLYDLSAGNGGQVFKMFYTAEFTADGAGSSLVGFAVGQPAHVQVTHNPSGHARVASFREAMDIVANKPNAKITVHPGTYYEADITITKPVEIYPHDETQPLPVLDFSGGTSGFIPDRNGITIRGLYLKGNGSGYGIRAQKASLCNLSVSDLHVSDAEHALLLHGTASGLLTDIRANRISTQNLSGAAVVLQYTGSNVVISNSSFDGYTGYALTVSGAAQTVDAGYNWWGTLCPGLVVQGDVNYTPWASDNAFSGWLTESQLCVATEVGNDIALLFSQNLSLLFNSVTSSGTTSVVSASPSLSAPDGYRFVNGYYEITTTAEFAGDVAVTLPYDPGKLLGSEERLELFHYENGEWKKITQNRDTVSKTVTGLTQSFSPFSVCEPLSAEDPAYSSYGINTNLLWLFAGLCCGLGGLLGAKH